MMVVEPRSSIPMVGEAPSPINLKALGPVSPKPRRGRPPKHPRPVIVTVPRLEPKLPPPPPSGNDDAENCIEVAGSTRSSQSSQESNQSPDRNRETGLSSSVATEIATSLSRNKIRLARPRPLAPCEAPSQRRPLRLVNRAASAPPAFSARVRSRVRVRSRALLRRHRRQQR